MVGVYRDDFWSKQQLLARIDPATFSVPAFLGEFDRKRDQSVAARFAREGWLNVNDILEQGQNEKTKESLARLVARCAVGGMPSLASLKLLLGSEQEKRRAASIDDLLEGL